MVDKLLAAGGNYGLVGFVLVLMFLQAVIFLKVIHGLFMRMVSAMEKSAAASAELTTYMRGRNGRR